MKKLVLAVITILIMTLSTGCGSSEHSPEETIELPDIWQPTVEATLPSSNLPEIVPTIEESTQIEITETEIETTTEEETTVEETTTVEPATTIEETTVPETTAAPQFTFTDIEPHTMYVMGSVNVRSLPSTEGEICFVYHLNDEVWVTGKCNETGWYRIDIEGHDCYMTYLYLSEEKYVAKATTAAPMAPQKSYNTAGFVYYSVSGVYPNRDYEEYLYSQLNSLGIAWWYPYAVAQIFQESRWNPNSTNGRDHGICQFKGIYFQGRAEHFAGMKNADIWNPYDSLKVYAYYIKALLAACNNKVDATLSYYICGDSYNWDQTYINHVMGWYYKLG